MSRYDYPDGSWATAWVASSSVAGPLRPHKPVPTAGQTMLDALEASRRAMLDRIERWDAAMARGNQ